MSLRVFVTGGTFDKEYDELTGTLHFAATHSLRWVGSLRSVVSC